VSLGVGEGRAKEATASNALSCCPDSRFRQSFYRHDAARAVQLRITIEIEIEIDRLAPRNERTGEAGSTSSILAERFTD
jgi:hypothetical protein